MYSVFRLHEVQFILFRLDREKRSTIQVYLIPLKTAIVKVMTVQSSHKDVGFHASTQPTARRDR
jgi:hypothetical protein